MISRSKLRRLRAGSALPALVMMGAGFAVTPQAAFAQAAPATETASADDASSEIIITGTRIRRPNLDSGAPITSVQGDEFFQTGQISVGDVLNELPQLRSTFSQQNSTRFLGTRGLNLLDLRGLGSQRTLVLVNGRRHVGGDLLNNAVSPDVNTFPTDLIERVDLITGGGSAVYGSDAVAGAVNFVLKQDYQGVQVRGQSGISKVGDAGNQYVSVLAGTNFAGGRGNIAANFEYAHQSAYFASARKQLRQANGFVVVDSDPANSVNGSDGVPDRVFLRDIRSTTIALGGLVSLPSLTGACGRDTLAAAYNCTYLFGTNGTLSPETGQRVGLAPNGSFLGGNGYSGREGNLVALSPNLDRYSVNLLGHYEVSDAFVPFFEAKYVRTVAQGSQSGPFFSQGTTLGGDVRERVRLDNPYLAATDSNFLTTQARALVQANINPNTGARYADTAAGRAAQAAALTQVNNGSFGIYLRRNWLDLGIRDERITRETYRAVAGVRGDFNDDWHYELSANYGEHREKNRIISNVNTQRYLLAMDTVRNPATGQIVCRSQLTPSAAGEDAAGNAAQLAQDVAACVPLNPFGQGSVSQAARNYLTVDSHASGKITQFVANGFISGDSSQFFELPGGPVGFSVGGEYRRETVRYDLDALTQAGYAFYNAIPSFRAPSFAVKEAFGELNVPILKDMPFFRELTLSGSGRFSDYKGSTGKVYTYGGEIVWRPIDDLRLRASYTRATRAPNLVELYSAQGQNFLPPPSDPCSARNLAAGSTSRAANCTAAGRPANYDFVYTQSLEYVSGGNPDLKAEKSDNFTIGGVITPHWVPGLSITVDYYNIKVKNVISSVDAQTILNNCYDSATLSNPFCSLFQRAGANGGPRGEQAFQILDGSLLASQLNFAKLKARGIDTEVAYHHNFGFGAANFRATWTRVLQRDDFTDPSDPNFADRILGEVGDPKNRATANVDLKVGKVTFGYQVRWIGKMKFGQVENTVSVQGNPPENLDYSDAKGYGNVFYHDIRTDFDLSNRFSIYAGVDNVLDRYPPWGATGIGAGLDNTGVTGLYDNRGRYFYVGAVAKF
jgi:outer membrane receptor protein involved in Fe transport